MHVLIVDDHAFVCVGLKATLLDEYQGVTVTTADNRTAALAALENGGIDLVIADLFMPGAGGGFDFIALLCDTYPELPVIVLSASENPAHIRKCLDYGAIGFVTKSAPRNALFDAIKRALNGERYVPESLRDAMPQVAKIMDEVDFGVDVSVVRNSSLSARWKFCSVLLRAFPINKLLANWSCQKTPLKYMSAQCFARSG